VLRGRDFLFPNAAERHEFSRRVKWFSISYWSLQVADMDGCGFSSFVNAWDGVMGVRRKNRICGDSGGRACGSNAVNRSDWSQELEK
jgi:hypothetical protein